MSGQQQRHEQQQKQHNDINTKLTLPHQSNRPSTSTIVQSPSESASTSSVSRMKTHLATSSSISASRSNDGSSYVPDRSLSASSSSDMSSANSSSPIKALEGPPEEVHNIDEEEEFVVERIVDKRIVDGQIEYFLKWKGYPESENTWEPVDNLEGAPKLIKSFEARLIKQKASENKTTPRATKKSDKFLRDNSTPSRRSTRIRDSQSRVITISDSSDDDGDKQQQLNKTISFTPKHSSQATAISRQKLSSSTSKKRRMTQSQKIKLGGKKPIPILTLRPPRAETPDVDPDFQPESSCSEQELSDVDDYDELRKRRKLKLKEIIGAVKDKDILLVVKWHGICNLEKVPLSILRRFHSQEIIDYFLDKIRWSSSAEC